MTGSGVIVGAMLGAVAAAVNGVQTWDKFLFWVVGGAIGERTRSGKPVAFGAQCPGCFPA
jgi:hypothetical protein